MAVLERGSLLLFDLGFLNFARFDHLSDAGVWFVTRKEERTVVREQMVLQKSATLHDRIVQVGSKADSQCRHPLRLVEWVHADKWYRYLTNVLDPTVLPAEYVVALYWQRWRIEDCF